MDGRTDGRTDKASYRVACPQLKTRKCNNHVLGASCQSRHNLSMCQTPNLPLQKSSSNRDSIFLHLPEPSLVITSIRASDTVTSVIPKTTVASLQPGYDLAITPSKSKGLITQLHSTLKLRLTRTISELKAFITSRWKMTSRGGGENLQRQSEF